MRIKQQIILLACSLSCLTLQAREEKRALEVEDLHQWRKITLRQHSDDGQWMVVATEPVHADGNKSGYVAKLTSDPEVMLYHQSGREVLRLFPVNKVKFSGDSKYMVASTRESDTAKEQRLIAAQNKKDKKGKEDTPLDTLYIYSLQKGGKARLSFRLDSIRTLKMGEGDWLAYQRRAKDSTLYIQKLGDTTSVEMKGVTGYGFSPKGNSLYYVTRQKGGKNKPDTISLYRTLPNQEPRLVRQTTGRISNITFDEEGRHLAFLQGSQNKAELEGEGMQLWLSESMDQEPRLVSDSTMAVYPAHWVVSPWAKLSFSKDGQRLIYGIAPAPQTPDSTILRSSRPNVQVWSWDEPEEYLVQETNRSAEAKRTYEVIYHLSDSSRVQLTDTLYRNVRLNRSRRGEWCLVSDNRKYGVEKLWMGESRYDYAVVSLLTGERRPLRQGDYTRYSVSPEGGYAYGYSEQDSLWRAIDLATGQSYDLTSPATFVAWDEEDDHPCWAPCVGEAFWLKGEQALIISDRYDLWRVSVHGGQPQRITLNGREEKIRYRLQILDEEQAGEALDGKSAYYLSGFDEVRKTTDFYRTASLLKSSKPQRLTQGNCQHATLTKAKRADVYAFTRESFEYAADLWLSTDRSLRNPSQLTHLVDQQEPFLWGTAELVHWTSYKGVHLEGMLFKPADFDPSKKYPLIVNFYERYSHTLHSYRVPQPNRSTPDYHLYTSRGYVIFNPDVRYVDGHPGECCYDCVLSGIDSICSLGFIDETRIGGSGHSWGGYQMAYLATRTDRFAAIESGAPVVNMFSAFGGIRWATGRARAFQYEHGQSRVGGSPWEVPALYQENSPLFQMDKVSTPILIMHNDADGHVPQTQGIEMFIALKRLQKPCWLLNYMGEPHWPCKTSNRLDFQVRLLQFFDHYLKGEPMPRWMREGIRAVDRPNDLGY